MILRLYGMYGAFKTNLETSLKESTTPDRFIRYLVSCESDDRRNRVVARAVEQANFRSRASLEDVDYTIERGLNENRDHRLPAPDFSKEHKDLFILALLDIIEDRHRKKSTIMTSRIPVKEGYDIIGGKTIAEAVLDRIVRHALRVEPYGESLSPVRTTTLNTS